MRKKFQNHTIQVLYTCYTSFDLNSVILEIFCIFFSTIEGLTVCHFFYKIVCQLAIYLLSYICIAFVTLVVYNQDEKMTFLKFTVQNSILMHWVQPTPARISKPFP